MAIKSKAAIKPSPAQAQSVATTSCKCSKDCGCCEEKEKAPSSKSKVTAAMMVSLLSITAVQAQDQGSPTFWDDPFNSPMLPLYLTLGLMAIAIVLLVIVIAYTVKAFNILIRLAEEERAAKLGVPVKHQLSWWDSLWQRINKLSPIENEKDIDTGHDFDGIRELDNHLPPWWKWLFYATIVWSAIYLVVYHVTDTLPLSGTEYQNELAEAEREARALRASRPAEIIDLEALTYVRDEAIIARGKAIFASNNCGSCHRGDGGGNAIGPNLTDEYWLHGGSIKNIYQTIDKGFVEKGMPAWGKVMSAKDVHDVAFFVMSLKGSNPVDGRAPQGDLFKEEPKQAPSDTTRVQAMNN